MSKLVLTVDDSGIIRDMLRTTLSEAGYEVLQAEDGARAMEVLQEKTPDLILTDINMPNMDGYEFLGRVRANHATRAIPVLVLTTEYSLEKKTRARDAGATGWILKPFNPEKLLEAVRRAMA